MKVKGIIHVTEDIPEDIFRAIRERGDEPLKTAVFESICENIGTMLRRGDVAVLAHFNVISEGSTAEAGPRPIGFRPGDPSLN
jgi:hypothetical protein